MSNESFKLKHGLTLTPVNLTTVTNPQAGDLVCDINDNNKIKRYDETLADWVEVGSGAGGGLDVFHTDSFEDIKNTDSFSTGNNAAFLGGGTLAGTLSLESVAPISGITSLKYTQAAGSLNDYFASELIDLDPKQRDNTNGMSFYFEYDGADNDGRLVVYDVTNSQEIASEVNFVKLANKSTRYSLSFYVPASCTQIRWGYKVLVANSGRVLKIDDVEMSTNPFVSKDLVNITDWEPFTPTGGWTTNTTYTGRWRRVGDTAEIEALITLSGAPNNAAPSISLPSGLVIDSSKLVLATNENAHLGTATVVDTGVKQHLASIRYSTTTAVNFWFNQSAGSGVGSSLIAINNNTIPFTWGAGDKIAAKFTAPIVNFTASTTSILTPSDTFSTDTAPLTYANAATYTLSTLANAPIGTYITFTYAINTNTRTQTTGTNRPTQTDADMNQNGIRIFTRAYNAASTSGNPAAFAIQIGKGLKGHQLNLYKNTGKSVSGSLDSMFEGASIHYGSHVKEYNEATGTVIFDAAWTSTTVTARSFLFSDATSQNNGYLTINAGRSLPLLAVPVPLTAYLKDVKPSGTAGGTFTSGAWQTRTLNTVEGDGSIVSLSGSQFQLGPGKYEIEASAPAFTVNRHQSKLRNITTSTDTSIGSSEYSGGTVIAVTKSHIASTVVLTTSTIFEIQHRCETSRSGDGFAVQSGFGVNELFSIVKITKVG
jgi:hypothetical protein